MNCVCSNLLMDGNPSSFGPANRRPPEERNAHNWFLQKIMRSHNGCDNYLSERATTCDLSAECQRGTRKLFRKAKQKKGLSLVKQHRFPEGVPAVGPRADTKVVGCLRGRESEKIQKIKE